MCVFPFTPLKRLTTLLFIFCPAGIWLYPNRSILSSRGLWWRWWRHGICPCPASCTPVSYFTNCFCFMAAAVSCLLLSLRIKAHFFRYLPSSKLMLSFILTDVFKSALRFGTFTAVMVTYTASALLHVSTMRNYLKSGCASHSALPCVPVFLIGQLLCLAGFEFSPGCSANISWVHHVHWARWESA